VEDAHEQLVRKAGVRFNSLAGVTDADAEELVVWSLQAAQDQALETIAGAGPVPSGLVALKAEFLYFVCLRAKRVLEQREVEVLFRTLPATARTILATMRATYEEAIHQQFVERMRRGCTIRASGSTETSLSWTLTFADISDFLTAWDEVIRLGLSGSAAANHRARTIVIARSVGEGHKKRIPLTELGLEEPSAPGKTQKQADRQ
jgi:hypothetical protein